MHQAMRHFFQNGGGPCFVVSVGDYKNDIEAGDDAKGLISGFVPLIKEQEPTMVVVPDAVQLPKSACVAVQAAALKHCGYDMKNRVAILDVWGGHQAMDKCVPDFRDRLEAYEHICNTHQPDEIFYYLGVIGVHPSLQGKGAGKALLDHFCERSRADPKSRGVYLDTANAASLAFYYKNGFELCGEGSLETSP